MNKVLLISRVPQNNATTIEDHVNALVELSDFEVKNIDVSDPSISSEISKTDCILLHYSVIAHPFRGDHIISSALRLQISRAGKPVLHMVQDEQRNVLERFRYFEVLGVKHVFSVATEKVYNLMYPTDFRSFTVSTLLTGYMPMNLDHYPESEWSSRAIDISYRARRLPEWYGELGSTKSSISDKLNEIKKHGDLIIDASCKEDDRLYGQDWIDFLCNSKVAVGTESGSSTLDMDGRHLEEWQNKSNIGTCHATEPISANYAAISPRIFEYAAAKCLMALTPGEYSGILSPGIHYFELHPDLSNFNDLLTLMNNREERSYMIQRTYEDLISSRLYGYEQMVREVDTWIGSYLERTEIVEMLVDATTIVESKFDQLQQNLDPHDVNVFLNTLGRFKSTIKERLYAWGLSRRGILRVLLRAVFRVLQLVWTSKLMKFLRLLISSNSYLSKEFRKTFRVTGSIFNSARLIPELVLIRNEAEIVASQGTNLEMRQTNAGLWLTWPESIDKSNKLKEHPKLDSVHFQDAKGVWITRSDYSEVNMPLQLHSLSSYYKKNKLKAIELVQFFSEPFSR
jgi:hypothetical protein